MGPVARPAQDQRNASGLSSTTLYSGGGVSAGSERNPSGTQMSRAEKFEDEKRRIIDGCFAKREADGSSMLCLNRKYMSWS